MENVSSQLNEKMDVIYSISEQSSSVAEEVSASSQDQLEGISQVNEAAVQLSDIAGELQSQVGQYRFEDSY
ncbi:hypothetical protein D9X91_00440 [Falsibacillus albus]|uniref:Methyl-accepting chemotaxis protein n=1 Tax=Falsibacillus albus TaxID=2478915 RepID=A0A3L7K483_9BACI|nr:hypothetical protein D9X91_00440 [Falsibacillus albus]